ncbi:sigma-70 family RNA polymerase sigma factor [Ruminococcaceae bacterium OttesenSCG-928-A16]|nr:sigma-70 family RNA polymerase sigma factor [Ruminococcaceae bacterium OttesenSCG-928-A16]
MEPNTLTILVEKAKDGNTDALLQLCEQKSQDVLYICMRIMGNKYDGEDAAQEVFIRLIKNLHRLQNPSSFSVWLNKIIMSTCNDMRRRSMKNSSNIPLSVQEETDPIAEVKLDFLPGEYAEEKEKREQLLAVVQSLPQKYLQPVLLFYYQGLTLAQTAKVLNKSVPSVDHALRRARTVIKNNLESQPQTKLQAFGPVSALASPVLHRALQLDTQENIPLQYSHFFIQNNPAIQSAVVALAPVAVKPVGAVVKVVAGLFSCLIVGAAVFLFGSSAPGGTLPLVPTSSSAIAGAAVPQQPTSKLAEEDVDIINSQSSASIITPTPPVNSPSSVPAAAPAAPQSIAPAQLASASGQLYFQNNTGDIVDDFESFEDFTIQLWANGQLAATTTTNSNGGFTFNNLAPGEYTLQTTPPTGTAYVLQQTPPPITITSGQQQLPPLPITDITSPTLAIAFYGQNGQRSSANPARAILLAGDDTPTTCTWQIINPQTGAVLHSGLGTEITDAFLQWPHALSGMFTLQATATDIAGNQTTAELIFYIV